MVNKYAPLLPFSPLSLVPAMSTACCLGQTPFSCVLESAHLWAVQVELKTKEMCCCKCSLFYIVLYYIYYYLSHLYLLICLFSRADLPDFLSLKLWTTHIVSVRLSSQFEHVIWAFQLIHGTIFIHGKVFFFFSCDDSPFKFKGEIVKNNIPKWSMC